MFYLTNRYQYVSLGQTESEPQPVSSQFSAHYYFLYKQLSMILVTALRF